MSVPADPSSSLAGRRILVVEDEYFIAVDLGEQLAERGVEVVGPVATVPAALEAVAEGGLDAAILDINLGEVISVDVADALTAAGIPFVLITGYDEDFGGARFAGMPRVAKPAEIMEITAALANCMAVRPAPPGP